MAREDKSKIVDINMLRKLIKEELFFSGCNRDILIKDFTFLVYMIGNDFLHRLPLLHDTPNSMNVLLTVYKNTRLHLTSKEGKVQWKNLLQFWKNLDNHTVSGYTLYELHVREPLPYPHKEFFEATTIRNLKGQEVDENYDRSKHKIDFDKKHFTKLWYEKQFKPRKKELISSFKDEKYFDKRDVINMCKFYLRVLEWNLGYYLGGHNAVSKNLFYPFFYSPMLPSLINYLDYLLVEDKMSVINDKLEDDPIQHSVIHQLMLIMPPQSKNLIPEPFRKLYLNKLQSITPTDFIILKPEGTDKDHVTTALIPPINPYLVTRAITESGFEIPDKYKDIDLLIIMKESEEEGGVRPEKKHKLDYEISQKFVL